MVGTGKGNEFPITVKRETKPQFEVSTGRLNKHYCKHDKLPLKQEKPHVLQPEYDNLKDFFEFKINSQKEGVNIVVRQNLK